MNTLGTALGTHANFAEEAEVTKPGAWRGQSDGVLLFFALFLRGGCSERPRTASRYPPRRAVHGHRRCWFAFCLLRVKRFGSKGLFREYNGRDRRVWARPGVDCTTGIFRFFARLAKFGPAPNNGGRQAGVHRGQGTSVCVVCVVCMVSCDTVGVLSVEKNTSWPTQACFSRTKAPEPKCVFPSFFVNRSAYQCDRRTTLCANLVERPTHH